MEDNAAAIVDDGHAMWEQGLADPNAPWAEYVTDHQRAVLNDMIARIYRNVASRQRLRAQMLQQIAERKGTE